MNHSATTIAACAVSAALALLSSDLSGAPAAAPDLTNPAERAKVDTKVNYNLGPTGLRGWIHRGGVLVDTDDMTGHQPWQILVTSVGKDTPAQGVLAPDDVILGVSTGAGKRPVPLFTQDSRKSMGLAIGAAEAGDGVLNLKCWRAGTTKDVSFRLPVLGAYAKTAPYDCPKSARILAAAVKVLAARKVDHPVMGLALLATGDKEFLPRVRDYARAVAPKPGTLDPYKCDTWGWSYNNLFLTEYYLATGDKEVLDGIREYTVALAKAQSMFGTYGHGGAENHHDGTYHGSVPTYGPVNQCGLSAVLSIMLGKKCGVVDPEVEPAIERANKFFSYYVQKGTVPYGEHEPWHMHAASNGKNELTAVFFALQGKQPAAIEYFTRMALAGYETREIGHTGQGFSYLWGPLGAAVGGPEAVAAYLAQVRWHQDLSRRCDGSFTYDGTGDGANPVKDYWDPSNYSGFLDPTVWNVLALSLPKHQLFITGKSAAPGNTLKPAAIANAIWSAKYPQLCAKFTAAELLGHFAEYDPLVRRYAADEFAKRPEAKEQAGKLIEMTGHADPKVRETACQVLGVLKPERALPVLVARLRDKDGWVRVRAARALRNYGTAAEPQLAEMIKAFIANGSADANAIDWSNPLRLENAVLAGELFGTLGKQTRGQPKELLYPAVRVGLAQPSGMGRSSLGDYSRGGQPSGFLMNLSWEDVQALAPSIVACAAERAPADLMFAGGVWNCALAVLGKYRVEEGIPLSFRMYEKQTGEPHAFEVLTRAYRGAAKEALPAIKAYQTYWPEWGTAFQNGPWWVNMGKQFSTSIDAITNDPAPPELNYFKKINAVSATPPALTLPASKVTLKCSATDLDGGTLSYTWSKIQGEGEVVFTPNNAQDAASCAATFSAPGTYLLRVTVVDKTILDPATWIHSSCMGWHDFKNYERNLGSVHAEVTVKVLPAK